MTGKIYLDFLILCAILFQSICGTFADENIKESSISLVRHKRVISYVPGEDRIVGIRAFPYVVHIKLDNRMHCVGTILSNRVVITAAECVRYGTREEYKIVSNSATTNHGIQYNVTEIKLSGGRWDGIALVTINPPIVYNDSARNLELHVGLIVPGMLGAVSGWGFNFRNANRGTRYPLNLRTIQVPILPHQNCVNSYRSIFPITDKLICTYHSQKRTGHNDIGAPLVIDNSLAGIFLWRGPPNRNGSFEDYPDVFALLQHSDYSRWIRANI